MASSVGLDIHFGVKCFNDGVILSAVSRIAELMELEKVLVSEIVLLARGRNLFVSSNWKELEITIFFKDSTLYFLVLGCCFFNTMSTIMVALTILWSEMLGVFKTEESRTF